VTIGYPIHRPIDWVLSGEEVEVNILVEAANFKPKDSCQRPMSELTTEVQKHLFSESFG